MTESGVLFDVDGTLVDNSYLHTLAWARAFADMGEHPPMATLHRLVGMGSDLYVREVLGRDDDEADAGHSRHIKELEADMHALPGAAELLADVKRRGLLVVLATSAKEDEVEVRLETIGAGDDVIDHVTHSADVDASKPEPDIFRTAMEAVGLTPERTIAVGDSVWDVKAAAACGIACIGVESGGVSAAELRAAGAIAVYEDPADLLRNLDDSPIRRLCSDA